MKKAILLFSILFALPLLACCNQRGNNQDNVSITKYPGNYTAFKIITDKGLVIITDPFNIKDNVQANIVTISHQHYDHFDLSHIVGNPKIIQSYSDYQRDGLFIHGIAGHHNKSDKYPTNVIFIFDINTIRIAQFGAQGEMPTEEMFNSIGKVDVLIIQIMGKEQGKLTIEEAHQIALRLNAKIIIPAHGMQNYTSDFSRLFKKIKVKQTKNGILEINKEQLLRQKETKIVILDN